MSTLKFTGNAASNYQLNTITPASVAIGNTFTLTINSKTVTFTATANTVANVTAGLVALLNSTTAPPPAEFSEITWADNTTNITGTSKTLGLSFTQTSSASGGTAALTTVVTTAESGPNDISLTANSSTGSIAVNSDTIIFEGIATDCLYGLAQNGVTGVTIKVNESYSGKIGLPYTNPAGYAEYRTAYLRYGISVLTYAGKGSRAKFDCGSTSATITVNNTGTSNEAGLETLLLKGSSIAALNVNKGSVAVAAFGDETSAVTTANIAYVTNQASDAKVRFGSGCTLATLNMLGGQVQTNQALTTVKAIGGTHTHRSGNITTYTNEGATLVDNATHTITTYIGTNGSVLDASQGTGTITITNSTFYKGAKIKDPNGRIVFTNPYTLSYCGRKDVDFDFGVNLTEAIVHL